MIDPVIEAYVDAYPEELSIVLLQVLAHPSQGGRGYRLEMFNPTVDLDGFEVDHEQKVIWVDQSGLFTDYTPADVAEHLRNAIQTEFLKTRAGLLARVGWGSGKVVLGLVEGVVGLVGIIVPEPGTTAGGVVMVALGGNTIADGVSQLAGANKGNGVNLLSEGAGMVGASVFDLADRDPEVGRTVGKGVFFVGSIAAGSFASFRVLKVAGQSAIRAGVGGYPGGLQLGRLDLLYKSGTAGDGMTILSINNNTGQSILRFVTHSGKLMVNGRIVGQHRILQHESNAKAILKGILKLMAHGLKS